MKNVIFDWSGVVKDAFDSHHFAVNYIFQKYGLGEISKDILKDQWEEPFMLFFNKHLPGLTIEQEKNAYKEAVLRNEYPKAKPFNGIVELIKNLHNNGYFVGVITSDLKESFNEEIKNYGLEGMFDEVVTDVHDKTESLRELVGKNNLHLMETCVVGDSNNEVIAAKKIGIKSIAVTWGLVSEHKLRANKPDYVVHTVDELEGVISPKLTDHGVVAVVKDRERVLLLKDSRDLMFGKWGPPHGRCELTDQNEEAAVIREVFEETGLRVEPVKKMLTIDADTKVKTVSFWLVELLGGDIKIDSSESSEYGWFTLDEALGLNLYPGTKKFFEMVLSGEITIDY